MPSFKIFAVGDDRPEYIVAMTEREAIENHLNRIHADYYVEEDLDIQEVPLNTIGMFETEPGEYKEMTFSEFLGSNFVYTKPQLICWGE